MRKHAVAVMLAVGLALGAASPAKAQMTGAAEIAVLAVIASSLGAGPVGSLGVDTLDQLVNLSWGEDAETVKKAVEAADWSKARTITINFDDEDFSPNFIRMKAGVPYVFRLEGGNDGGSMRGPAFFRQAGVGAITGVEGKAGPQVRSLSVSAGVNIDVQIVALQKGLYEIDGGFLTGNIVGTVGRIEVY
ncbi:MAG: hypothetical protein IT565_08475 [Rhodospirillales bacterium]|nr:hypothetical protein [Rhodospirillales bacterium]